MSGRCVECHMLPDNNQQAATFSIPTDCHIHCWRCTAICDYKGSSTELKLPSKRGQLTELFRAASESRVIPNKVVKICVVTLSAQLSVHPNFSHVICTRLARHYASGGRRDTHTHTQDHFLRASIKSFCQKFVLHLDWLCDFGTYVVESNNNDRLSF